VSIHISALMSRLNRDTSPGPSKPSSRSRTLTTKPSSDALKPPDKLGGSRQMLTASEVTERRKARRLLEYKRVLLEEAVERRACEKVYDKIWRHKSTLDEVRDEKLRSKTAALALVGIGLKDLGIEIDSDGTNSAEDVQESLAPAREGLARMNEEHYPLGKLQHLTAAHKAIVDTLSTIHPSSSSADEILPTLIYTLITSPVEGINIISNLYFIQRFRATSKIDGEAAYCLTNLEAAISFLENVDLTTLRADEMPEGPKKTTSESGPAEVEKLDPFPPLPGTAPSASPPTTATTDSTASGERTETTSVSSIKASLEKPAMPTRHQRTLSDLLQPISNANEAVRSTAEEGFKNISSTLDNSFKFLFGKLKERGSEDANAEVIVPKTLDEARRLVSRPLTPEDDDHGVSDTSSTAEREGDITHPGSTHLNKTEDRLLTLLGGRKAGSVRERSVDSVRSNSSAKKVAFAGTALSSEQAVGAKPPPPVPSTTALDSVKSFGTSLNPINHIGSALGGAFRGFGSRPAAHPSPPPTVVVEKEKVTLQAPDEDEKAKIRAHPPIAQFMAMTDASELKIGQVPELLKDYQRLARVLGRLVVNDARGKAS